jgi:hypothetical protein
MPRAIRSAMSGIGKAGHVPGKWNEGVGEHVRTRSRPGFGPVKLRSLLGSATNEENFVSSAGPVFGKRKFDPAVDLMSRRHPLSSTGAFQIVTCFREADRLKARVTRRHQPPAILSEARFTSSSWRPCGSSSQSSSLRSSPSSPSSLSWPCCPPNKEMTLVAACIRESKCTTFRIHQRTQKNSVPLKEVLTSRSEGVRSNDIGDTSTRSHTDAKSAAIVDVVTRQY